MLLLKHFQFWLEFITVVICFNCDTKQTQIPMTNVVQIVVVMVTRFINVESVFHKYVL